MSKRAANVKRSINPLALTLTLVLVGCAVLVGVFGPRLRERASGAWTALSEVSDAARQIALRMEIEAIHRPLGATTPSRADLAALVRSSLANDWRPPDFTAEGFVPVLAGPALLPGSDSSLAILYEGSGELSDNYLALFVARDRGEFASFNEYGQIEPFSDKATIIEPDDPSDPRSGATLVFRPSDLLVVVRTRDVAALERVRSALGAP
ncbi:MAG: hypothetical protein EXS01_06530 [Phycisphaerales bacterium]|nr:hypothetical protein [Phycisphaerales bacterium]